jgi:Holliday junction resolvase
MRGGTHGSRVSPTTQTVTTMGKGSKRERQACNIYQRAGWATYRPATVRFGENDIFGLFDHLAVSPRHSSVHAVQTKSNGARGIRDWTRHTALFRRLGFRTFYLVPYDREGWKLIEAKTDTEGEPYTRVVVDERQYPDVRMEEMLERHLREVRE